MKVTYDRKGDAAYIYLTPAEEQVFVSKTYPCDPFETGAEINLDFDSTGILIGIEVLGASKHLHHKLLQTAKSS
jgi:uncharacterized protein YuzE